MTSTYLNTHMIGFSNYENLEEKIQGKSHTYSRSYKKKVHPSPYIPLYQLSNMCLENGYSVLYGAESIPDESAEKKYLKT